MNCEHKIANQAPGGCFICLGAQVERPAGTKLTGADLLELERSVLCDSLAEFFKAGWHLLEPTTDLIWGWHLDAICDHIQACIEDWARRQDDKTFVQRLRNLAISVPPGCSKSRIGVYALAWAWLRWPGMRVICLSANPRVALRDSMLTREVIASEWYQQTFKPTWSISASQDAKGQFNNTAGGYRSALGMDSRIVGARADLLWIDDPHDPEEAQSPAQRESVIERWDASISNRVNDLGSSLRICIAQRVHEADFTAHVLADKDWHHLNLPLLFEVDAPCETILGWRDPRMVEGECLHPARFPEKVVEAERKRLGSLMFATLYQQRPAPAGGALFKTKWWRFYRKPGGEDASATRPKGCHAGPSVELPDAWDAQVISADLAFKKGANCDYNVIQAWGRSGPDYFLLAQWRQKADFPEVLRAFRDMSARFPFARKVVEAAANGHALVSTLQGEVHGLITVPAQGSKEQRAQAILPAVESANVYLPEDWNQLEDFLGEAETFPSGRHDDAIDAMSLGVSQLIAPPVDEEYEESRTRAISMELAFGASSEEPSKEAKLAELRAWMDRNEEYQWRASDISQLD